MRIEGARILVTGASRGIGRALAEMLVAGGACVGISGRDAEALDTAARALRALGTSDRVVAIPGDVARDVDAGRMVSEVSAAFDGLDAVVNNAGILSTPASIGETSAATWREVLDVNVVGTANVVRHALPVLESGGGGLIVNVSSTWGRSTAPDVAPYCASKFAVEALTSSLAQEHRPGVVVVAVNPGVIATAMLATAFRGDVSSYPAPASLAPAWRALFEGVDASWNGRSLDLWTLA